MTPLASDAAEGHLDDAFANAVDTVRRSMRTQLFALVFAAVFLCLSLLTAVSPRTSSGDLDWSQVLRSGPVGAAEATAIVLTLLTVVAALGIALVAAAPRQPMRDQMISYAAVAVWSGYAVITAAAAAALSLAIGLSQWFVEPGKANYGLAMVLTGAGVLSVISAAGVTTYTGRDAIRRSGTRRTLDALRRDRSGWRRVERLAPRKQYGWRFLAVAALSSGALAGAAVSLQEAASTVDESATPWPYRLLVMALTLSVMSLATYGTTAAYWKARAGMSVSDRWWALVQRSAYVLAFSAFFVYAGVLADWPAEGVVVVLLWIGGVVVPSVLLFVARRYSRGPMAFMVRRHVDWVDVQIAEMVEELGAEPVSKASS